MILEMPKMSSCQSHKPTRYLVVIGILIQHSPVQGTIYVTLDKSDCDDTECSTRAIVSFKSDLASSSFPIIT